MEFECFRGKRVLVTGNTGFKGSWLSSWLLKHGAEVIGLSDCVPTIPSLFEAAGLEGKIHHNWGDVRKLADVKGVFERNRPDFVFHLAAQPLVKRSYAEPALTFETNVQGTLNVLESLRLADYPCIAVMITSDKCYDNVEQVWGYRENDRLGGKDPYSGSKGAAEMVIRSYHESFFSGSGSRIRVGVGRAGNVIGGGDWAADRIVPDAVRAWTSGQEVTIRRPRATRPWQLVLEPLGGYLCLASRLKDDPSLSGQAFNFGPLSDQEHSVAELLDEMIKTWPGHAWKDLSEKDGIYEAGLLKLCCDKAQHVLEWRATLGFPETIRMTSAWYQAFYAGTGSGKEGIWDFTLGQIAEYEGLARAREIAWAT